MEALVWYLVTFIVVLFFAAVLSSPVWAHFLGVRVIIRLNAHRIHKRLRDESPRELVEETDKKIEQCWESIREFEKRPGITQGMSFGEALDQDHRELGLLRDYRRQVIQIAKDRGLDVRGLEGAEGRDAPTV